jgi:hypothetical protein
VSLEFDSPIEETALLGMIDRVLARSEDAFEDTFETGIGAREKAYALTALAKMYPRCASSSNRALIRRMLAASDADADIEIQTRSVEYGGVLEATADSPNGGETIAEALFAAVPKMEGAEGDGEDELDALERDMGAGGAGGDGRESDALDLAALLSLDDVEEVNNTTATTTTTKNKEEEERDAFRILQLDEARAAHDSARDSSPLYSNDHLAVYVEGVTKEGRVEGSMGRVHFVARYASGAKGRQVDALRVQAAVPKHMKLRLEPPSGGRVAHGADVTQRMSVEGAIGDVIVMKIRFSFEADGAAQVHVAEIRIPV